MVQSHMTHMFSKVPSAEIQRSSFDRSHGLKTAFNAGYLVPVFCDSVLPGDSFNLKMTAFCRFATPLHPIMDNAFIDSFWFFVPYRLIWDHWEEFNGQQANPGDTTDYLVPIQDVSVAYGVGSIHDYFGLPTGVTGYEHSALPLRAYNLVWNEWFRDQNLQNSLTVDRGDGPDVTGYSLQRRGKRHDYFTSCLPWPQKGPAVSLPLGSVAPVVSTGVAPTWLGGAEAQKTIAMINGSTTVTWGGTPGSTASPVHFGVTGLETDLTGATAATINQLRQAFQVQRLYERDARGGTRYTEIVRAHFGVVSPDARLQRPEYLGGGSSPLNISAVVQNSSSVVNSPQGNLAGMGTSTLREHGFSKSFTEHGVIIGLVSMRADLTYQQGLNRDWSRRTRWDFYWPALAHIGEQAVLNKEIYCAGVAADENVFGYQERFAEYRYKPSLVTGIMRSTAAGTLDTWHWAQDFASLPLLNSSFIVENPPIERTIAVETEPHLIGDFYFQLKCARPMPVFGVPGLIDHF